ncbi:MAG TPA: hypothetical protein VMV79_05035, partial [Alphaproteobacteria bacterium]|nr:hypothetical protein [Alphaproteobacteria bacterium]
MEPLFAFQKQADLSEIDKGEIRALNSPEKLDLALAAMSNPDREVPARQAAIAVLASKDLTAIAKLAATLRSFIVTNDRSKLQRRIRADHARAIDLLASEIAVYFAHGKKETAINLFERTKALLGQFLNEKKQTITHYDFSEHGYRGLLTRQRAEAAKKAAAAWQAEENDLPSFEPDQILWWPQAARHVVYIRKAPRRAGRALEAWTRNLFDPSGRHMSGAAAQFRVARRELCKWDSREIVAAAIAALQEPAAEISPPSEETLKQALSATDPTVPARLLRDVHALTAQTTGPSEALIAAERRLTENLAERVATYVIRIRGVKRATREANPHRDLAIARIEQVLSGKFFPVGLNNFLREEGQLFARKRAASKENPSRKNRTSAKFHSGEIVVLLPAGAERTVPRDDVQKLDCESDVIRAIAALHEPVAAPPPRESMDEALRLDIVAVAGLARDLHPLAIASDPFLAWAKTPY